MFGTLPRGPGDQFDEQEFADLLQGQLEPGTAFATRAELRASARRAFTRGEYASDIVCYLKEDQGWSPACRLIGFDGNKTAWLVQDTNDPETPHSLMEPEFERGNTPPKTRPRSSEELLNDGPIALRRRVEVPPQQLDLTPGELRADHLDYRSLQPQWHC